jgi:hypothetical protein
MIVVASAGNEGSTFNPHIGAPADAVSVLAIGAVNSIEIELLLVLQVPLMTSSKTGSDGTRSIYSFIQ